MTYITSDGQIPEAPDAWAYQNAQENTPVNLYDVKSAEIGETSVSLPIFRAGQRAFAATQSYFENQPKLPAEDINKSYGPIGPDGKQVKITDQPMYASVAQLVGKAKKDELTREGALSRASGRLGGVYMTLSGIDAFLHDPLNAATTFIPGVGEEAVLGNLARVGIKGATARVAAKLIAGGTAGAAAQLPLSAVKYTLGTQEASDYSLRSAMKDVLYSAAGAAAIHTGLGTLADSLKKTGEATPRPEEKTFDNFDDIANSDSVTKHAAMRSAISQLADGREVAVDPFFNNTEVPVNPEEVASKQADIYKEGFSPGMTQDQVIQATREVFEPEEKPKPKPRSKKKVEKPSEEIPPDSETISEKEDKGVEEPEKQPSNETIEETKADEPVSVRPAPETLSPEHLELEEKYGVPEEMNASQLGKLRVKMEDAFNSIYGKDIPDEEFQALDDYARRVEEAKERAPKPVFKKPKAPIEKPARELKPENQLPPEDEDRLQQLEQELDMKELSPEEKFELQRTSFEVDKAEAYREGYEAAAECLADEGA